MNVSLFTSTEKNEKGIGKKRRLEDDNDEDDDEDDDNDDAAAAVDVVDDTHTHNNNTTKGIPSNAHVLRIKHPMPHAHHNACNATQAMWCPSRGPE